MTEQECLTANWADQGFRDGRSGYPLSRLEDHREACAKVGVVPDALTYQQGRDKGVLEYCTPENAVYEGRHGRSYRNACPMQLESAFLAHYRPAYRVYQAEKQLEALSREAKNLEYRLHKEKNDDKRRKLREDLRYLDHRLFRARHELLYEERRLRTTLQP